VRKVQVFQLGQRAEGRGDVAAEIVAAQVQQALQLADVRRNRPGQVILGQAQLVEVSQLGDRRRDRAGELVAREVQHVERRQAAELRRHCSIDLVAVDRELGAVAELDGDRSGEHVVGEREPPELRQRADLVRDRTRQPVAPEHDETELPALREHAGHATGERVVRHVEQRERRDPAQRQRDGPGERVAAQAQALSDADRQNWAGNPPKELLVASNDSSRAVPASGSRVPDSRLCAMLTRVTYMRSVEHPILK
jgi:hypothetical protein